MNGAKRFGVLVAAALLAALGAGAQQPAVINAKQETRSAAAGLRQQVQALLSAQTSPVWAGYAAPAVPGNRVMCCGSWSDDDASDSGACGRCALEATHDAGLSSNSRGPVKLEGSRVFFVLLRIERGKVNRVTVFTEDCQLDAGGLRLIWLTSVRPEESVELLAWYATAASEESEDSRRVRDGAMTAVALTADASADRALEGFVAPKQPDSLRERAAFWLGAARGRFGLALLQKMARQDPSDRVRGKVAFALSVSQQPEAVEEIIHMAREDSSGRVRAQALFWLGQKAGEKAAGAITDAIRNDPDTQVKNRAVFALSQLPKEEGVPLLIQLARDNSNPVVRKQAMFWLGQSNDPRALEFFEQILAH